MGKFQIPPRKKVGRNWFVCDRGGKIVQGLAFDKGNGYYYYSGYRQEPAFKQNKKTRRDYQFGRDYDEAIFLFRQWEDKEKAYTDVDYDSVNESGERIENPQQAPKGSHVIEEVDEDGYLSAYAVQRQVDDAQFWAKTRSLILHDIQGAAKKLGFPCLLEIEDKLLKHKDVPKLTLTDVFNFYWDHTPNTEHEKRLIRVSMFDFRRHVKDEDLSNIDEYDVISFNEYLHSNGHCSHFINKRVERVITCLNYYNRAYKNKMRKRNLHEAVIKRVVKLVKENTEKVKEEVKDTPKTFDVETLKKLFGLIKGDDQFVLVNLLALNCGFYAVDVERLAKDMIRNKDGLTFISYPRDKVQRTSPRIIVLFEKTASLLHEYIEKYPNDTDYVFLNRAGTNCKASSIQKKMRAYKERVKHEDGSDIDFKHYRDTVASSLIYKVDNSDLLSVTLGQDFTGKRSVYWKYVQTRPEEVKCVADILYSKFKSVIDLI